MHLLILTNVLDRGVPLWKVHGGSNYFFYTFFNDIQPGFSLGKCLTSAYIFKIYKWKISWLLFIILIYLSWFWNEPKTLKSSDLPAYKQCQHKGNGSPTPCTGQVLERPQMLALCPGSKGSTPPTLTSPSFPWHWKWTWRQWEGEAGVWRSEVMAWWKDQWGKTQQGERGGLAHKWFYPTQAQRLITPLTASWLPHPSPTICFISNTPIVLVVLDN